MRSFSILLVAAALTAEMAFAQPSYPGRYKLLHFQSEKLKADSLRIVCVIEVPKDIGLPSDNPISFTDMKIYRNGVCSYRKWRGPITRKAGCPQKELRRFSYTVYHDALKFLERNESTHDYSFYFPFYIHKVAKKKENKNEGACYNELNIFKRIPRKENVTSYLSCDGQFLLKLHADGQFVYTRATLGQSYGGHWSFHGDTLKLSSPYFENNPQDLKYEYGIYKYKYTDESYDDRFILRDGLLYPITRKYDESPFMPYDTLQDRRRYKRNYQKYFILFRKHI